MVESTQIKENYKDAKLDYEYEFYSLYLSSFKDQVSETKFIKVNDELQECFMHLTAAYQVSKSVPLFERGMEDKLADSFMFYVSLGVIVIRKDGYYINTELLARATKQFNFVTEKGTSYKKGGIK